MPDSSLLFKLANVVVEGDHQRRLDDVTVDITEGVTAIIGFSGAGKTSLLNLLVGFERPANGVVADNIPSSNGRLDRYWVPQNDGLWPQSTVGQHLEQVSPSGEGRQLLEAFGLEHFIDRKPEGLSRGERSRLSVARALASQATVLIMDEPLSHVDPARESQYWRVVSEWCREHHSSLIFATHSPEQVLREADRVICLEEGKVVFSGDVGELYNSPASRKLAEFLGPCNWLEPSDASELIGRELESACVRPERLLLHGCEDGKLVVVDSVFVGSVCDVHVRNTKDETVHVLKCRPPDNYFKPGDRVRVEICS